MIQMKIEKISVKKEKFYVLEKEPHRNCRTKKHNNKIKTLLDGFICRVEMNW